MPSETAILSSNSGALSRGGAIRVTLVDQPRAAPRLAADCRLLSSNSGALSRGGAIRVTVVHQPRLAADSRLLTPDFHIPKGYQGLSPGDSPCLLTHQFTLEV
jgi:hypothetical protein